MEEFYRKLYDLDKLALSPSATQYYVNCSDHFFYQFTSISYRNIADTIQHKPEDNGNQPHDNNGNQPHDSNDIDIRHPDNTENLNLKQSLNMTDILQELEQYAYKPKTRKQQI